MRTILWMGAAVLGAAAFLWHAISEQSTASASAPAQPSESNLFPFVRSMEGTQPDGNLTLAAGDALVINQELRHLFDYYLSALGERPLKDIDAEIGRELSRRLKPTAATQAKQLFARYLDYKHALASLEKNPQNKGNAIEAMRARLTGMQQIRNRFFSAKEIEGMFGFDDAYDNDALARFEVSQDKTLTATQKQTKLAVLDAALPPTLREARDATLRPILLEETVTKMREQSASDDDVYRARAAEVGPEAAARLAEIDREQAAWKARITVYLAERKRLLDTDFASEANKQLALQQLRNARFSSDEQKRLMAYE